MKKRQSVERHSATKRKYERDNGATELHVDKVMDRLGVTETKGTFAFSAGRLIIDKKVICKLNDEPEGGRTVVMMQQTCNRQIKL